MPFKGVSSLYRAWLYSVPRPRDVTRKTSGSRKKHWRGRAKIAPAWFVAQLHRYRPDADPDRYWTWRLEVFRRAGWQCERCSVPQRTVPLDGHHVRPWRDYPRHRYEISNGMALCRPCHDLIDAARFPR